VWLLFFGPSVAQSQEFAPVRFPGTTATDPSANGPHSQLDAPRRLPSTGATRRLDYKLDPYRERIAIQDDSLLNAHASPSEQEFWKVIERSGDGDASSEGHSPAASATWDPTEDRIEFAVNVDQAIGMGKAFPIDLASLIDQALVSSPQIAAFLTTPRVSRQEIIIADSEFDSRAFIDARFSDISDPIGSQLTTGNAATRFLDQTLTTAIGARRRARSGGNLELAQRGGYQSNNSDFLIPNPQSTTRLELNFTQPLMRDRGRTVNQASVVLAQLRHQSDLGQARAEIESHLVKISRAYWELSLSRAHWRIRQQLYQQARDLVEVLRRRSSVDSTNRQVLRAEVASAQRLSALTRLEAQILDAQAKLRALTGDARFASAEQVELIPLDEATLDNSFPAVRDAKLIALDHRAEIDQSLAQIRAVSVRVGASKNQLLPRLDLILSGYVSGLADRGDAFDAFADQFSRGRPSFAAGFAFERPRGNRSASARVGRNQLELNRAIYRFRQQTEDVITEVEIARRALDTAANSTALKTRSAEAAQREVDYLQQRWEILPDPTESVIELVEDLIEAQDRLGDEQRDLISAKVDHELAQINLRRAMGILVTLGQDDRCVPHAVATVRESHDEFPAELPTVVEHAPSWLEPANDFNASSEHFQPVKTRDAPWQSDAPSLQMIEVEELPR